MVRNARARRLSPDKDKAAPGADLIKRRHPDWKVNQIGWRRMLDSYEGGQRYRDADYGPDRKMRPIRNLIRHRREYPDALEFPNVVNTMGMAAGSAAGAGTSAAYGPYAGMLGADPAATAMDDDYEMRRARTPVPEFVGEAVWIHLSKLYDQEVSRRGPDDLLAWWKDCNAGGVSIGEWMRETVAPLLLVLGNIDIVFDRPKLPDWVKIETKADEIAFGQDRICAAYILPQNMVWWENDPAGNYRECLVREYWSPTLSDREEDGHPDDDRQFTGDFPNEQQPESVRWRHWTQDTVTLYDSDGQVIEPTVRHGYPCVPIVRLIDRLRHRTPMIGKSTYEYIAELQRDYYNRNSELILSDTLQACPLLSGPEEFCRSDATISIGPDFVLPKHKVGADGGYEGWEYVSPSKEPANSIRENLKQIRDEVDRAACLLKPAGVTGTTGGTVSQSGYSKAMDAESGNKLLSSIAKTMARAERQMAEFALMCARRGAIGDEDRRAIYITYPTRFQLKQGAEILNELVMLTQVVALQMQVQAPPTQPGQPSKTPDDQAGGNPPKLATPKPGTLDGNTRFLMPTLLAEMIGMYARAVLPGRDASLYRQIDQESQAFYHLHALPELGVSSDREAMAGAGTEEAAAGEDRSGRTGATLISPSLPRIL